MKNKSPTKDTKAIDRIIDDIQRDFRELRGLIESLMKKMKSGEVESIKTVDAHVAIALKTLGNITLAEIKLDDARQKHGGAVSNVAFDFADARKEVLGKLDRIAKSD